MRTDDRNGQNMRTTGASPLQCVHHEGIAFTLPIHKRPAALARPVPGAKVKKAADKNVVPEPSAAAQH